MHSGGARAALSFPRSRVGIDVDVGSSVSLVTEEKEGEEEEATHITFRLRESETTAKPY